MRSLLGGGLGRFTGMLSGLFGRVVSAEGEPGALGSDHRGIIVRGARFGLAPLRPSR